MFPPHALRIASLAQQARRLRSQALRVPGAARPRRCASQALLPRQAEVGMPLLRHYPPQEYSGGPSVGSIVQDRRGVLFFGVGNAVLEYDGVTWRKIRVPGVGRSLALDAAGKIWVGAVTSFGWLEPDAHDTLQ